MHKCSMSLPKHIAAGVFAFVMFGAPAIAGDSDDLSPAGCKDAVGVYLSERVGQENGKTKVLGRDLLSLTSDSQAYFTDSTEFGLLGFQPFSEGRGTWRCVAVDDKQIQLSYVLLIFTFPTEKDPAPLIARLDFQTTLYRDKGAIEGDATVSFVALDKDPFDDAAVERQIKYTFNGYKIQPRG